MLRKMGDRKVRIEEGSWQCITAQNRSVYNVRKTCVQTKPSSVHPAYKLEVTHTPLIQVTTNHLRTHSLLHTNYPLPSTALQSVNAQLSTLSTQPIETIYLYKERKTK